MVSHARGGCLVVLRDIVRPEVPLRELGFAGRSRIFAARLSHPRSCGKRGNGKTEFGNGKLRIFPNFGTASKHGILLAGDGVYQLLAEVDVLWLP